MFRNYSLFSAIHIFYILTLLHPTLFIQYKQVQFWAKLFVFVFGDLFGLIYSSIFFLLGAGCKNTSSSGSARSSSSPLKTPTTARPMRPAVTPTGKTQCITCEVNHTVTTENCRLKYLTWVLFIYIYIYITVYGICFKERPSNSNESGSWLALRELCETLSAMQDILS